MKHLAILATAVALAACGTTPTQQTAIGGAVATLAGVAAAQNSTVASIVTKGGLFCSQKVAVGAPLVVALANLSGAPVSVTGMASKDVAAACGLIGAIPVPPPADPASVPVAPVATTLPAA